MQRFSTHLKNNSTLKVKRTTKGKNSVSSEVISNIINFSKAYQAFSQSSIEIDGVVLN